MGINNQTEKRSCSQITLGNRFVSDLAHTLRENDLVLHPTQNAAEKQQGGLLAASWKDLKV